MEVAKGTILLDDASLSLKHSKTTGGKVTKAANYERKNGIK